MDEQEKGRLLFVVTVLGLVITVTGLLSPLKYAQPLGYSEEAFKTFLNFLTWLGAITIVSSAAIWFHKIRGWLLEILSHEKNTADRVTKIEELQSKALNYMGQLNEILSRVERTYDAVIHREGIEFLNSIGKGAVPKPIKATESTIRELLLTEGIYKTGRNLLEFKKAYDQIHAEQNPGFRLEETYTLGSFLRRLLVSMEDYCIWFGITKLVQGWMYRFQDDEFSNFNTLFKQKAEDGKLAVFRLFCIEQQLTEDERDNVREKDNLEREKKRQLLCDLDRVVKAWPENKWCQWRFIFESKMEPVKDISLLWGPLREDSFAEIVDKGKNMSDINSLLSKNAVPRICAMEFEPKSGAWLRTAKIVSPSSNDFLVLSQHFLKFWKESEKWAEFRKQLELSVNKP